MLVLATAAFLWWWFDPLLKCPSCYLFVNTGDGLKNYFTPLYFIEHDTGFWFTGMNYPYGEHIVYTDNQPVWSCLLKLVHEVFPLDGHVIGIFNMLMVASVFIGIVCVYYLLRQWQVPKWASALFAVPVILLSPQLERINGHYGLSYVFYIPLFLLLFTWWTREPKSIKRSFALIACVAWMSLTHLYFLLITTGLMAAYVFVVWLAGRFRWRKEFLYAIVVLIACGTLVYLPVRFTDPIRDRPEEVYGLLVYTSKVAGTFLPWYGSFTEFWRETFAIKRPEIEGMNYVGSVAAIAFLFILFQLIRRSVRTIRNTNVRIRWSAGPHKLLAAAFLVWLFSTGLIYTIGGSKLLDIVPVLGQFRSLGRLGWMFYYIVTCYTVFFLLKALGDSSGLRRIAWICVICIAASLWYYESFRHFQRQTAGIYHQNTAFRGSKPYLDLLKSKGYGPSDFQAILQLPMVSIGSEKMDVPRGLWTLNTTFQCSHETGLPIIDSNMSRTSVSQALKLLQLISDPSIPKARIEEMDDRPILLLADINNLITAEHRLVDLADPIGQVDYAHLYHLPLSAFYTDRMADGEKVAEIAYRSQQDTFDVQENAGFLEYTHSGPPRDVFLNYWTRITAESPGFPPIQRNTFSSDGTLLQEEVLSQHSYNPWNVMGDWVEVQMIQCNVQDGMRQTYETLHLSATFANVRIMAADSLDQCY